MIWNDLFMKREKSLHSLSLMLPQILFLLLPTIKFMSYLLRTGTKFTEAVTVFGNNCAEY